MYLYNCVHFYRDMPHRSNSEEGVQVVDDSLLAKLMDMGYNCEMARNALIITRNDLDEAVNLLICNADE